MNVHMCVCVCVFARSVVVECDYNNTFREDWTMDQDKVVAVGKKTERENTK